MNESAIVFSSEQREKLIDIINDFFGCDAAYYDINPFDLATHLMTNGVTVCKWIPVTERLPDKKKVIDGEVYYRNVAVRVKNLLHERIAYYDPEIECWVDTGFFQIRGVTHWAELPAWEEGK